MEAKAKGRQFRGDVDSRAFAAPYASLGGQVKVLRSSLLATIAGGDRTVNSTSMFTVDASSSYDPDSTRYGCTPPGSRP